MNCPVCSATLETITYEGIAIETCPSCGGEWLDDGELLQVAETRDELFSAEERQAIANATSFVGVPANEPGRRRECPKCGAMMQQLNYAYDTGVIIDRCTANHGVWLDASELEKVQIMFESSCDLAPETLARFRDRLRAIERKYVQRKPVRVSRFAFVNALIARIIDIAQRV